jgi:hypothetical protein
MPKKKKEKEEAYSLDKALKEAKKAQSSLQDMLQGVSDGEGFYKRKKSEVTPDENIKPKLNYEKKAELEKYKIEAPPQLEDVKSVKEKPSFVKDEKEAEDKGKREENVYLKLTKFVEELFKGYNERYNEWEDSISNILSVLRKMRKITKKNTEDLVGSINKSYDKIQHSLEQFKMKRDEIEKVADVDVQSMSKEFKNVLGLLELQVKEYRLKRLTDELFRVV